MDLFMVVFEPLVKVLAIALELYMYVVIARALISWVNPDPYNPIVRFLTNVTEPALAWIRRLLPIHFGGIDLTPMILILGLILVQNILMNLVQYLKYGV